MNNQQPACVVSVAGTDPSGGAGIAADIKTISATGAYAATVITAVVAQNTQGVQGIYSLSEACVQQQFASVFSDLAVSAVKVGMLQNKDMMATVFSTLRQLKPPHVVLDPVMVAKGGAVLLDLDAIAFLKEHIADVVHLLTPNTIEAEHLLATTIRTTEDMAISARRLGQQYGMDVLVKGGHLSGTQSSDVLYVLSEDSCHWFHGRRVATVNTHGTGCSLSSAIASYLAQGLLLRDAIAKAKAYLTQAIAFGAHYRLGQGQGPVDHFYFLENRSCRVIV